MPTFCLTVMLFILSALCPALWWKALSILLRISDAANIVEENKRIILPCPLASMVYISRHWYRGNHSIHVPPPELQLFSQRPTIPIQSHHARSDMSVDPSSFALIIDSAKITDDIFTCRIYDDVPLKNFYDQKTVQVYSKFFFSHNIGSINDNPLRLTFFLKETKSSCHHHTTFLAEHY